MCVLFNLFVLFAADGSIQKGAGVDGHGVKRLDGLVFKLCFAVFALLFRPC